MGEKMTKDANVFFNHSVEPMDYEQGACSNRLRWRGVILKQAWEIGDYKAGRLVSCRTEWRPVPLVDAALDASKDRRGE